VVPSLAKQTTDWPLWWFAQLEAALKRADRVAATAAIRKLEQLGFEVRFTLPPQTREAGARA
jgi:hypothetical protein